MPLAAGQTLSFYEILGPLGTGAMGEVYRAKDTRLDREVAIKVLPEHFADDEDRLRRFEREAKSIAALNHPNVAQIYGVDQVDDTCFLVLELVPGETLEDRIARGALPLDEALDVCGQIADGLEAAHEAGVIHRDLKPANVRITPEGRVKVLDFGLAKPVGEEKGSASSTDSVLATEQGRLLGTPTYMAPEQARGKHIDRRIDVWAFGCVLYECLTAERAYGGETMSDVLAAVLQDEPDWTRLPQETPPHVRHLLERCLAKSARVRLRDIGEARLTLEQDSSGADVVAPGGAAGHAAGSGLRSSSVVAIAVVAALVGGFALRALWPRSEVPRAAPDRLQSELLAPVGTQIDPLAGPPAVSPDGARVAFSAIDETGLSALWVRELNSAEARRLPGTERAVNPFWAPDGRQVGFSNSAGLQTIGIDEDRPRVVIEGRELSGASWNEDGTIIYAQTTGPIMRVDARGGTPELVLDPVPGNPEAWGMWPRHLPDGSGFLFAIQDRTGVSSGLYACKPGSTEPSLLSSDVSNAVYLEAGRLLYRRGGSLYTSAFDLESHELGSESVRVARDVRLIDWPIHALFGASPGGRVVYIRQLPGVVNFEFVWVDMESGAVEPLGVEGILWNPSLSPDGTKLAFDRSTIRTSGDVWVRDLVQGVEVQITKALSDDSYPLWSPSGEELYFYMNPSIYRSDPAGLGEPELVMKGVYSHDPDSITRDGGMLLFSGRAEGEELYWLSTLDLASGETERILSSSTGFLDAELSPDNAWFAARLDDEGIVVASFPGAEKAIRVPSESGSGLRWSRDGTEVLFASSGQILAVPLEFRPGAAPIAGTARVVLERNGAYLPDRRFDVSTDGRRLLVVRSGTRERHEPLTLLENAIEVE